MTEDSGSTFGAGLTICRMRRPQRQLHFPPGPGPGPGPISMRPSEPTASADPTKV